MRGLLSHLVAKSWYEFETESGRRWDEFQFWWRAQGCILVPQFPVIYLFIFFLTQTSEKETLKYLWVQFSTAQLNFVWTKINQTNCLASVLQYYTSTTVVEYSISTTMKHRALWAVTCESHRIELSHSLSRWYHMVSASCTRWATQHLKFYKFTIYLSQLKLW